MAEKNMKARIVHKHDTAVNWEKATGFIPKKGEIVVYDIDDNFTYERIKIGDGAQNVNALPFVTDALETAIGSQITIVSQAVLNVASLVGDTAVSEQINTAIESGRPKATTINLVAANWTGETNPWSQVVTVNGSTVNSKIDLYPSAIQIVEMQNNDIAFMAENDDGVITVYAIGSKPDVDYSIHALITEVVVV